MVCTMLFQGAYLLLLQSIYLQKQTAISGFPSFHWSRKSYQENPGSTTLGCAWTTYSETVASIVEGWLAGKLPRFCRWPLVPWQPFCDCPAAGILWWYLFLILKISRMLNPNKIVDHCLGCYISPFGQLTSEATLNRFKTMQE